MNREKCLKACLFRAQHRGSREADMILGGFAATQLTSLTDEDLDLFSKLLTHDDQDIFMWLQEKPDLNDTSLHDLLNAFIKKNYENLHHRG